MKPEITKEQAKAIATLREHHSDGGVLNLVSNDEIPTEGTIYGYDCSVLYNLDLIELAAALINGYQIAKSPEEKVREYYERNHEKNEQSEVLTPEYHYSAGTEWGIKHTLYLLGMKIEGVTWND
ncbi:hypothetical protein V7358_13945 [Bacillus pumilus]|uniref:hypothetical protein n=1 Tax=Bacillus pumilus TaxID=1408 RepID=UPI002FFE7635